MANRNCAARDRVRRPRQQAVPAPAARRRTTATGSTTTGRGRACCTTSRTAATRSGRVRAGTQRQMDVYTIRKLCDIADQYAEGHVRFTIRSNIEFMVSSDEEGRAAHRGARAKRLPGRRHRQLGVDDRAHAGLAALRHPGHRRLRRGEGADGRAPRGVHGARTCPTACTCPPPAARSTAAARPTSRSSSSTPSRRRSTTTSSPTSASVPPSSRAARSPRSARRW